MNRTGYEGSPESGLEFWGNSFVADPFGRVIAQATASEEKVLVVECDPKQMDEVRRNWPFLRDRRIDAYAAYHAALARLADASVGTVSSSARVPHAGGMGGARSDLDRLAAREDGLAGQIRSRSRGFMEKLFDISRVWRGVCILMNDAEMEQKAVRVLKKSQAWKWRRSIFPCAHGP